MGSPPKENGAPAAIVPNSRFGFVDTFRFSSKEGSERGAQKCYTDNKQIQQGLKCTHGCLVKSNGDRGGCSCFLPHETLIMGTMGGLWFPMYIYATNMMVYIWFVHKCSVDICKQYMKSYVCRLKQAAINTPVPPSSQSPL